MTRELNSLLARLDDVVERMPDCFNTYEFAQKLALQHQREFFAAGYSLAEQEEKSKVLEASSEDAQTIREAGEEIAASLEEKNAESTGTADPNAPTDNSQAGAASQDSSVTSAPAPASNSAVYPASAAVGDSVDTHA